MTANRKEIRIKPNDFFCKKCRDTNWLIVCGCNCGEIRSRADKRGRLCLFLHAHGTKMERHPNWRGGEKKDGDYIRTIAKDHQFADRRGRVPKHRLIYEESRNCCLLPWADVHHKDDNPKNNVWYNLQAFLHGEHAYVTNKDTKRVDKTGRKCIDCGSSMTYTIKRTRRFGRSDYDVWRAVDREKNIWRCGRCEVRITQRLYRKTEKYKQWKERRKASLL